MFVSAFELFKVGIGPSSSHTVGPMRAAQRFISRLSDDQLLSEVTQIRVRLHGSLAHTGRGHGTDIAIMLGLEGETPDGVDVDTVPDRIKRIQSERTLTITPSLVINFNPDKDLKFDKRKMLKLHSNGMVFQAFDELGALLHERTYFSIGAALSLIRRERRRAMRGRKAKGKRSD